MLAISDFSVLDVEIYRQRLAAVAEQMGAALERTGMSPNIRERRDFSCAVFDGAGQILAHAAHIPVHLGAQPLSVAAVLAMGTPAPGALYVLNDPYHGGTHLPDVTVVAPVFLEDADERPAFYVANRAHHADIGGRSVGSMPSALDENGNPRPLVIDDEGFRCGPTLLDDAFRQRFAQASRTPDQRIGDLRAQEAAIFVAQRELRSLAADIGSQHLTGLGKALLDYGERRMRKVLAGIADGDYHFCDPLDGDGLGGPPLPLCVTATVQGDSVRVDFSEVPDQVASSLNAVPAICHSATFYVLRLLAQAADGPEAAGNTIPMPANAGIMRPVEIITRPGSLCEPQYPAAVSAGNVETSQRLVDTLLGAFAKAMSGKIPAASCGSMNNVLFGGLAVPGDPKSAFVHYETLGGGAGASQRGAGADGIHTHMTNTLNTPVEELEMAFPVHIAGYCLRPKREASQGHLGGRGVVRQYRFLVPTDVTVLCDRHIVPPWSVSAKGPVDSPHSLCGQIRVVRRDGSIEARSHGHGALKMQRGDVLEIYTAYGGDFIG